VDSRLRQKRARLPTNPQVPVQTEADN